jgi:hypothetical protein
MNETDDISLTADQIRHALSIHDEIVHISVEINTLKPIYAF